MWHPHRCHKGDTWAKGQALKNSKRAFMVERLKVCSHMCEQPWGKEWGDKGARGVNEVVALLDHEILTRVSKHLGVKR